MNVKVQTYKSVSIRSMSLRKAATHRHIACCQSTWGIAWHHKHHQTWSRWIEERWDQENVLLADLQPNQPSEQEQTLLILLRFGTYVRLILRFMKISFQFCTWTCFVQRFMAGIPSMLLPMNFPWWVFRSWRRWIQSLSRFPERDPRNRQQQGWRYDGYSQLGEMKLSVISVSFPWSCDKTLGKLVSILPPTSSRISFLEVFHAYDLFRPCNSGLGTASAGDQLRGDWELLWTSHDEKLQRSGVNSGANQWRQKSYTTSCVL